MSRRRLILGLGTPAATIAVAFAALGVTKFVQEHNREAQFKQERAYLKAHFGAGTLSTYAKGGDPDRQKPSSATALPGHPDGVAPKTGEPTDWGPIAADVQKAADRAYPALTIDSSQTSQARSDGHRDRIRVGKSKHKPGFWNALGPTHAFIPGVLTFTGADYVTSGRITALAVLPGCDSGRCTVLVGAAGGGVWKTTNGLSLTPSWKWVGGDLGTNAVGTLSVDPNNARTIYLGTGEPNASQDSESGIGIYKSTDAGDHWTLLPGSAAIGTTRAISAIAIDPRDSNVLYAGVARAIRGYSSVTGGSVSRTGTPQPTLGVYKSTDGGSSWTLVWDAGIGDTTRGVTKVELDPQNPSTVYASAFQLGIYRSTNGSAFAQVFAGQVPGSVRDRTQFALTVKNGKTRIYATNGTTGPPLPYSKLYRVDDASQLVDGSPNTAQWKVLTSNDRSNPYYATYDFCTGQCWYDEDVVTPPGQPDTVFVLGSYNYGEAGLRSNGRAVLRSTTAGEPDPAHNNRTFTDLTWDGQDTPVGTHPDQHAIAFLPGNPNVYFEGSDGGLIRSSGDYVDISSQCDSRPLSPLSQIVCHRVLSAVPSHLYSLNTGLDTLQFQSVSYNWQNPTGELMGGTQDNGTWLFTGDANNWTQTIYGDGGQSGFDVGNPQNRFNTFFTQYQDQNFRGGDPTAWVVTSGPLFASHEAASFYMPIIADPKVPGTEFVGLQHVFRTTDNGGGQAFLEANCPEFTTPGDEPTCGDWQPLGSDLTGAALGDKAGLNSANVGISNVTRAPGDGSTLWAATATGRVFISKNANAAAPAGVVFTRLDSAAQPNRFVTGIAVDPANPNHAFISYDGYNTTAGSTAPGHVYEVMYMGGTSALWKDVSYDLGDLPIVSLALDGPTGDLYAGTDFGVLRLPGSSSDDGGNGQHDEHSWESASNGLPAVEATGLTLIPSARRLYVATHGLGIWYTNLPDAGGNDKR